MPIETAENILNKSIKNFVCIDDEFVEPFAILNAEDVQFTRELYTNFHAKHKNIKVIKFGPDSTAEAVTLYFENADIVIIDWELGHHPEQTTLKLLENAIKTDHVKYVFIYTNNKGKDSIESLEKIRQTLTLAFGAYIESDETIEELKNKVIDTNILLEDDVEKYLVDIESDLVNFLYAKIDESSLMRSLFSKLKLKKQDIQYKDICPIIRQYNLILILLTQLKNKLNMTDIKISDITFQVKNIDEDIYFANNKLVSIVSKKDTTPEHLLEKIYSNIASECDSYFSILSHEILYHFEQNFLSRAKSFARIDNQVIKSFVNYNGISSEKLPLKELVNGVYNDIFMSVLKNQNLTYIEKANDFFDNLADHGSGNIDEKVKYINSLISIDHVKEDLPLYRNNLQIEFGDIFKVMKAGSKDEQYAICVTPHCDCAYASKEQEFKFIFSSEVQKTILLQNTNFDSDFCTFLPLENDEIKIVYWKPHSESDSFVKTKSLALFSENDITKDIYVKGLPDNDYCFSFAAQQKENFTQRLLNESARHSIRVGVSYLNIKTAEECSVS